MNRTCNVCRETKTIEEFSRDKTKAQGRGYRCTVCDRQKATAQYNKRQQELEQIINPAKERGCCICGERDKVTIQFHHVEKKEGKWTQNSFSSIDKTLTELAKCVPVCANCHLRIHADKVVVPEDTRRVV